MLTKITCILVLLRVTDTQLRCTNNCITIMCDLTEHVKGLCGQKTAQVDRDLKSDMHQLLRHRYTVLMHRNILKALCCMYNITHASDQLFKTFSPFLNQISSYNDCGLEIQVKNVLYYYYWILPWTHYTLFLSSTGLFHGHCRLVLGPSSVFLGKHFWIAKSRFSQVSCCARHPTNSTCITAKYHHHH